MFETSRGPVTGFGGGMGSPLLSKDFITIDSATPVENVTNLISRLRRKPRYILIIRIYNKQTYRYVIYTNAFLKAIEDRRPKSKEKIGEFLQLHEYDGDESAQVSADPVTNATAINTIYEKIYSGKLSKRDFLVVDRAGKTAGIVDLRPPPARATYYLPGIDYTYPISYDPMEAQFDTSSRYYYPAPGANYYAALTPALSKTVERTISSLVGSGQAGQVGGPSREPAIPSPIIIERYPCAVFPDKMVLEQVAPVEIVVKSSLSIPYGQAIKITAKPGDQEVPILVTIEIEPGTFEFVGDYYDTLLVPVGPEDSKPVVFNLKAKREGYHIVTAKFFQGIPIGKIEMGILVVASKIDSPLTKQTIAQRINSRGLPTEPDLTLIIHEKNSQNFEYDIFLLSSDVPWKKIGDIAFRSDPETKFRAIFQDIEGKKMPANVIDRSIKSKGLSLYSELVPPELKNLYWTIRDKIRTVQVISEEPWIPWEIIKPWRKQDGKVEEDMFLCERYAFSRWQEAVEVKEKNQIYNVKVVVPHDTDLTGAKQESDWIQKLGTEKRFPVSIDSAYEELMLSLEQGGFDLLHISTHGQYEQIDPNRSNIKLQDGLYLRAEDISGNATGFGSSNPLIILNACQTGSQGFYLTGIGGWAQQFLEAGASSFIGTLWSINDRCGLRFSQELYSKLLTGAVLGEAVRDARIACRQRGDPSWLAYTLYGRPNHSIKLGYEPAPYALG